MSRYNGILLTVAVSVAVAACASSKPREIARFGPGPELEATLAQTNRLTVDLGRPAYVLALGVAYPSAAEPGRPITFQAWYPAYPTDARHFEAGRHRLASRQPMGFRPMGCRKDETPTIDGCRRPLHLLPGISNFTSARHPRRAVLIIASEQFVDPFPLAEHLYWELMKDWQRTARLVEAGAETLTEEMEPLLVQALGPRGWTASVGVTF